MATIEDLPLDIRRGIAKPAPTPTVGPSGRPFIGSKSSGYPGAEDADDIKKAEAPAAEAKADAAPCTRCKAALAADAAFCQNCGLDLKRKRAAETLGIEISDEDVQTYLFKGFLTKEIVLFGDHKGTFKSIQSREVEEADMLTEEHFRGRQPTDIEWVNYRSKVLIAFGLAKVDGRAIGDSAKVRLEYLQTQGTHLVELVGKKLQLFNQAITEILNGDVLGKS